MERQTTLETSAASGSLIRCSGDWTSATARSLERELADLSLPGSESAAIRVDLDGIGRLDTVGAWLLTNFRNRLGDSRVEFAGGTEQHRRLLDRIADTPLEQVEPLKHPNFLVYPFDHLGRAIIGAGQDIFNANVVQGRIITAFARTLTFQAPLRFPSFVNQFEQIVLRAIPIVALISLVVGAIITQQTILQLRNFGAVILVVDLAAILMFREIGVLLAAIMVAGRSGSAITAEVGAMRMREEFDALQVMGVDPYQALLLPRIVALVLGLPLLAFVGAMSGLVGAAIVAKVYGDIPFDTFIGRLQDAMSIKSVVVGMIKAPVMAFLVGLIASIEGLKVEGSSESLGRRTTSSVVKSIFIVIVADGLFAVFFAAIGV
jgi:phospholipid/cholesterol/gamma-HCH transport system permease protein